MGEYSLMERFADPELFASLSMGEKMAGSGVTMLMGMGTTFLVLILLWGIIAVMAKLINAADKPALSMAAAGAPASPAVPAAIVSGAAAPAAGAGQPALQDAALAAVIAAAIAAYEGEPEASSNLIIRKIRRVSGPVAAWAGAGHSECVDSRRM